MNYLDLFSGIGGFALGSDWVCWLMGYPIYWTDIDKETEDFPGFHPEPDIPRLTTVSKNRKNRLQCLGSGVIIYEDKRS